MILKSLNNTPLKVIGDYFDTSFPILKVGCLVGLRLQRF
jgi:hypothetical protein